MITLDTAERLVNRMSVDWNMHITKADAPRWQEVVGDTGLDDEESLRCYEAFCDFWKRDRKPMLLDLAKYARDWFRTQRYGGGKYFCPLCGSLGYLWHLIVKNARGEYQHLAPGAIPTASPFRFPFHWCVFLCGCPNSANKSAGRGCPEPAGWRQFWESFDDPLRALQLYREAVGIAFTGAVDWPHKRGEVAAILGEEFADECEERWQETKRERTDTGGTGGHAADAACDRGHAGVAGNVRTGEARRGQSGIGGDSRPLAKTAGNAVADTVRRLFDAEPDVDVDPSEISF